MMRIQQLIVYLVTNAVQALADHEANIRMISIRMFSIRTDHTPSGEICCTIEDSGPGIDRSHLSHLFENTFTTKKTGMGMGLIISRSIIEAHDGCIRAENNP